MKTLIYSILFFMCLHSFAQPQQFFRHNGRNVQLGDEKIRVLKTVGQPTGKMTQEYAIVEGESVLAQKRWVQQEWWFYNFGSRRFTYTLIFENKKLVEICKGQTGFDAADAGNCSDSQFLVKRMIAPEVKMICGEPDHTETSNEQRTERLERDFYKTYRLKIEEWIYNFGPGRFTHVLRFENGFLVDSYQGERGW